MFWMVGYVMNEKKKKKNGKMQNICCHFFYEVVFFILFCVLENHVDHSLSTER